MTEKMICGCDKGDEVFLVAMVDDDKAEVISSCQEVDHWESNLIIVTLPGGGRVTVDRAIAEDVVRQINTAN